jgi:DNA-binding NarL/FixJ family response regulator
MNIYQESYLNLTRRESEILAYIARGFSSKQIANKLFISKNTVDTHRRNIISKKCAD